MIELPPFTTYLDPDQGEDLPLPESIAKVYGRMKMPLKKGRPYTICNFVSSLDGVVTLNVKGHSGGGDISGFNQHDQLLMGILRAAADVVIVGTSQLRRPPGTLWTPESIFPKAEKEWRDFRSAMSKDANPLQLILTASGEVDLSLPIFQERRAPVAILTNQNGAETLKSHHPPAWVRIVILENTGRLSAQEVLKAALDLQPGQLYLIEGGPHLVRYFFEEKLLDEIFLTLAPQVAGRGPAGDRPGFVAGTTFAPDNPIWGKLAGLKGAGSLLFLRYKFEREGE